METVSQRRNELESKCYGLLEEITNSMKEKLDSHLDELCHILSMNESLPSSLKAGCVLGAILKDEFHDMFGNLDDKALPSEYRKQNRLIKRLIDSIYATL